MKGAAIEALNTWGPAWAGAMQRSLVEATIVLAIVGVVWWLLRRRMSSALAHGLFLLVLIKAAVPLVLPVTPTVVLPLPAPRVIAVRPDRTDATTRRRPRPGAPVRPRAVLVPGPGASGAVNRGPIAGAPPAPAPNPADPARLSVSAWLMLAWVAIVAVLLTRFLGIHIRMARRLRDARLVDPVDPAQLAGLVGLRRPVPIVETRLGLRAGGLGIVATPPAGPPGHDRDTPRRTAHLGTPARAGARPPRGYVGPAGPAAYADRLLLPPGRLGGQPRGRDLPRVRLRRCLARLDGHRAGRIAARGSSPSPNGPAAPGRAPPWRPWACSAHTP